MTVQQNPAGVTCSKPASRVARKQPLGSSYNSLAIGHARRARAQSEHSLGTVAALAPGRAPSPHTTSRATAGPRVEPQRAATKPAADASAATNAHAPRAPLPISKPPSGGAAICAIETSDWVRPRTTPRPRWHLRGPRTVVHWCPTSDSSARERFGLRSLRSALASI